MYAPRFLYQHETGVDRTGLVVWPGSRLLAEFLVDPVGARKHCAHCFTRKSLSVASDENCSQKLPRPPLLPEFLALKTPVPNWDHGPFVDGSACEVHEGGRSTTKGAGLRPFLSSAMQRSGEDHLSARSVAPQKLQQRQREMILDLGAGTGICGMAASIAFGCVAMLTDKRIDVLENLRENIRLNKLETSVRAAQMAWGCKEYHSIPAEVLKQSPYQMILGSDTVYPGKPFTDTVAFFAMVVELLDPEHGVLLLAYTPRSPSLGTQNMLTCAYRSGLRGIRLSGGWDSPTLPDRSRKRVDTDQYCHARTSDAVGDNTDVPANHEDTVNEKCYGNGIPGTVERVEPAHKVKHLVDGGERRSRRDSAKDSVTAAEFDASRKHLDDCHNGEGRKTSERGDIITRLDERTTVRLTGDSFEQKPKPSRRVCRPVLLAFRSRSMQSNVQIPSGEELSQRGTVTAGASSWLTDWERMFPDVHFKSSVAGDDPQCESTVDDCALLSGEDLWGSEGY